MKIIVISDVQPVETNPILNKIFGENNCPLKDISILGPIQFSGPITGNSPNVDEILKMIKSMIKEEPAIKESKGRKP